MDKILITGCAGFIGMHVSRSLLEDGCQIYGVDNLNDYYDQELKKDRLDKLEKYKNFQFFKIDISNKKNLFDLFSSNSFTHVINLAAQAGVRYSLVNPFTYINSNISGFMNILECCRHFKIKGLIYASSSSVYGGNKSLPFSEKDNVDNPISIYAASKKSNELMANVYSSLFNLKTTGLRFFTVYGPWGRPDMALYIFTKKILDGREIEVYNNGKMSRDFTYIDDVVSGVKSALYKNFDCEIFNLGNNRSETLMSFIKLIEKNLNKKAKIKFSDIQLGDVENTYANIGHAKEKLGFLPKTNLEKGISEFISWYLKYNDKK